MENRQQKKNAETKHLRKIITKKKIVSNVIIVINVDKLC